MSEKLNTIDELNSSELFNFRTRANAQNNRAEFNYANNSSVNLGREGEFSRKTNVNPNGDFARNYSLNNDLSYNNRVSRQNPYASSLDTRVPQVDEYDEYYEQNPYTARETYGSAYVPVGNQRTVKTDDYYPQNPYFNSAKVEEVKENTHSRFDNLNTERFATKNVEKVKVESDDFFNFRNETRLNAESSIAAMTDSVSSFKYTNEEVDDFALMPRIESKKRSKIKNPSLKICVAVYILIVAIIAAMILTNVFIGKTAEASNTIEPSYNSEVMNYGVVDGQVVQLEQSTRNFQYEVEEESNWFDKLCSAIENLSK